MALTRRELGKLALAAVPAAAFLRRSDALALLALSKPNSKWAGVQVGMNVPYNFHAPWPVGNNMDADEVLKRCVQLGTSAVELRSQPVELFMGMPPNLLATRQPRPATGAPAAPARPCNVAPPPSTRDPESTDAPTGNAEEIRKWRVSAPMSKAADLRKKYESAGVAIEIVKYDNILQFTDEVLDYSFELARRLGARAISCELPVDRVPAAKRLGQFADKHRMMIGFHGHTLMTPAIWEEAFSFAKHNDANLDIGHFVAGLSTSPVPFLKQHHDRITHLHVKDRKQNCGANTPFGEGDTPIKEVLRLIRDNKWNIQATIEFEYDPPRNADGSRRQWTDDERMAEMAKCMEYCKQCLLG